MKTAALLFILAPLAVAYTGFDAIQAMSVATFQCMHNNGYKFFVGRVWESIGDYDLGGMQNIRNAHAAGLPYVDGYIFPCLRSTCAHAANQVEGTINRLHSTGTKIGTLWLDVERLAWPADQAHNRQFILDMANKAKAMGVAVGVYTNPNNWNSIVGAWTGVSHLPLWWANWSGQQNFNGFSSFGGWTKPAIRQYAGDQSGPCGVSLDRNWYPDA